MQEIVLILSSLAGVATAAAVRKMPRDKNQLLSLGASSHIKSQISSLKIEKDILTKTISRLYQAESEFSKIQKDKLLLKYQHQLGIVLAKLEKLEQASHHPDLGPVGDGLITLMDQKLSKLDDRLYELSSKMVSTKVETPKVKVPEVKQETKQKVSNVFNFDKPKESKMDPIVIPPTKSRQSFELTTLTNVSRGEPKFPLFENEPKQVTKPMPQPRIVPTEVIKPKDEIVQEIIQPKPKVEDKIEIIQSVAPKPEISLETKPDLNKEVAKITEHKALPEPIKSKPVTLDDDFDDDADDLDKIKGDIMRVLSKLDQAEVE
jgi:myosin heavy subunit